MAKKFDFSGWATKADVKCSDGRIIMKDAFKNNDGQTVPLVWNHKHDDVNEVLGHALLENREEGVYAYCKFNDTQNGKTAKLLVQHGDVDQLSIYANQLKQQGPFVQHGNIRELSLVLAGANPEAYIENIVMVHGDDTYELEDEVRIYAGEYLVLEHSDEEDDEEKDENKVDDTEEVDEKEDEKNEKGEEAVAEEKKTTVPEEEEVKKDKKEELEHSDDKKDDSDKIVSDVIDSMNDEQKKVLHFLVTQALSDGSGKKDETDDDDESEGGNKTMKHNVFEQDERQDELVLSHADMAAIFEDAKRFGSLKESVMAHAAEYGIENIGELFPDATSVNATPELVKREDSWVSEVLKAVHHTPFSRIKSLYADVTAEQARAKGYVKGNLKVEEVIKAFKRITNPTTVYKKQKLDRDDVLDITEFDVVVWLKAEMRMMLDEELARAILIGDGRSDDSQDKINEECIRPIWTDSDVYTVKAPIAVSASATGNEKAKAFIKASVKSRKNYKGSGSPTMYMSDDMLTDCLLIEDNNGRLIYDSMDKLASALGVKKIVPVTVMENQTRTAGGKTFTLAGLYVNLNDYNVGADKGGAVNMFDDFDIDYNQLKYLIETRCSGALTKPFAAVALEFVTEEAQG